MLSALWSRAQGWLLMAGAVFLVLVGAYAAGGRAARRSAEIQRGRQLKQAREKRDEAVAKNDALDDGAIRDRARLRMRNRSR